MAAVITRKRTIVTEFEQPPKGMPELEEGYRWRIVYNETASYGEKRTNFNLELVKTKSHWLTGKTIDDRVVLEQRIASYPKKDVAKAFSSGQFETRLMTTVEIIMKKRDEQIAYNNALAGISDLVRKDDLR